MDPPYARNAVISGTVGKQKVSANFQQFGADPLPADSLLHLAAAADKDHPSWRATNADTSDDAALDETGEEGISDEDDGPGDIDY